MMMIVMMILSYESNNLLRSLINYFVDVADEYSRKKQAKTPNLWQQNIRKLSFSQNYNMQNLFVKKYPCKFVKGKETNMMEVLL